GSSSGEGSAVAKRERRETGRKRVTDVGCFLSQRLHDACAHGTACAAFGLATCFLRGVGANPNDRHGIVTIVHETLVSLRVGIAARNCNRDYNARLSNGSAAKVMQRE